MSNFYTYAYADKIFGRMKTVNEFSFYIYTPKSAFKSGNLHLTQTLFCNLVVWTPNEMLVMKFEKDAAWYHHLDVLKPFTKTFTFHIYSNIWI